MAAPGRERDDGEAAGRHGRRARQLLQRYLVVFGPIHSLERPRPDGSDAALESLIVDFFAGRVPSADGVAAVRQLTAELTATRLAGAGGRGGETTPWGRFDHVCARLGLDAIESDALLLLISPLLDAGTRWLVRAVFNDDAWRADALRAVLDPLASPDAATWAATSDSSTLVRTGLAVAAGPHLRPAPALLDYLMSGREAIDAAHVREPAECAAAAAPAAVMAEAIGRLAPVLETARLVIVRAGTGDGVPCLAAWAYDRRGIGLAELTAGALDSIASGALTLATTTRRRGVLVQGCPAAGSRSLLAALGELGVTVLVRVDRDAPLVEVAALASALRAPVVDLPTPTATMRRRWWRSALEGGTAVPDEVVAELATEPLGPDQIAAALALCALSAKWRAGESLSALRAACRELAPTALDAWLDRADDASGLDATIETAALAAMRDDLATRRIAGVVFIEHGAQPLVAVAIRIARELGARLYDVAAARALRSPEPVPRWLARVLAAAEASEVALVLSDLSALVAGAGDDADLAVSLLQRHPGLIFVSADERAYFSTRPP